MKMFALASIFLTCVTARAQSALPKGTTSYEVQLTWQAPASSPDPAAGYNVYRSAGQAATWLLLNAAPVAVTSYADLTVINSASYEYMVESVDAQGNASMPSNTALAVIPPGSLDGGSFSGFTT